MLQYIQVGNHKENRDKFISSVNKQVGKGNWYWCFKAGKRLYSWQWGMQLYEDAYYKFISSDISLVKELVSYSNVFEINRHDVDSKADYKHQQHSADHVQDIAIRRCLIRLGVWFKGREILDLNSSKFNHSKITFHLPHLINDKKSKTIQSWLDNNRMIVIAIGVEDQAKLSEMMIR